MSSDIEDTLRLAFMTLLENMKTAAAQLPIKTGVCCCGSPMDDHNAFDNHSPRDEGEYFMTKSIQDAEKIL